MRPRRAIEVFGWLPTEIPATDGTLPECGTRLWAKFIEHRGFSPLLCSHPWETVEYEFASTPESLDQALSIHRMDGSVEIHGIIR